MVVSVVVVNGETKIAKKMPLNLLLVLHDLHENSAFGPLQIKKKIKNSIYTEHV
jgi:hypothetical protein